VAVSRTDVTGEGQPPRKDGRNLRAERTRAAVVDALLALVGEGDLRPTADRIAARAQVSLRSVYQHFNDLERLFGEAADRELQAIGALLEPVAADGTPAARIDALAAQRAIVYEQATPMWRAALLQEPFSTEISTRMAWIRATRRDEISALFATELAALAPAARDEVVAGLVAAGSWGTWESLRTHQDLAVDVARAALRRMFAALLGA